MISLPLMYSRSIIGHAKVDDDLSPLKSLYLSCDIPDKIYRLAPGRPDVIQALLKDDEELRKKVHPYLAWREMNVRLARIALRPEMVNLITRSGGKAEFLRLNSSIGRITHVNSDRTDCRRENLREMK